MEWVFWAGAAAVAYSYVGYPLLLVLLVRLRPAPVVQKKDEHPPVTLLIVAHDEEACIEAKLRNCLELDYPRDKCDILVASDGSTDRTEEIVSSYAEKGVRLLRLTGPRGKPAALNAAVPEARGDILILCDARQRLARDAVRTLVANFGDPTVGAVSGELHIEALPGSTGEGVGVYWRYEKLIRRLESRLDSTVGVTGALYALRKELYRPLEPSTILDDVAIPMAVVEAGYRVIFEPLACAFDRPAETPEREYRRKVRTLSGNYQLVALRPALLNPFRNRLFFQLLSHKLSRLAVPWCLLAVFVASGLLAKGGDRPFFLLAVAGQIVFYLLAAAGALLEKRKVASRLLSVPYAFTLLNLAAAASLFGFLFGRERAAWRASVP